jgi:hypothetical protein
MKLTLPHTHLTPAEVFDEKKAVTFPVRFDSAFDIGRTNLVSRMVESRMGKEDEEQAGVAKAGGLDGESMPLIQRMIQ